MRYVGRIFIAAALAAVLLGGCGLPTGKNQAAAPADNIPDTRRITSKYIGCIRRSDSWDPGPIGDARFAEYWNQVTPENSGKWGMVEPRRDRYNFSEVTEIYNYAVERGYKFNYHCLLWGRDDNDDGIAENDAIPSWFRNLSDNTKKIEIYGFMNQVFRRFRKMNAIDVVNEPINAPFTYADVLGGAGKTGYDWVIKAYEVAKQYRDELAPNCKLLINEYGVISSNPDWDEKNSPCKKYWKLIKLLKDRKLIDGIGVQCHSFDIGPTNKNIDWMVQNLDYLGQLNLPIYLSEFDISKSDDNDQLERYQDVFSRLFEHSAVKGVTFWGYVQGELWDGIENAYLLRSDNTERPVLGWLKEEYLNPRAAVKCIRSTYTDNHLWANSDGTVCLKAENKPYTDYQWTFKPMKGYDGNYGRLYSTKTGLYLGITNASASRPTVICEGRRSSDYQRWYLERFANGTVRFKNKKCNKYLKAVDPPNGTSLPTLVCEQAPSGSNSRFDWRFK